MEKVQETEFVPFYVWEEFNKSAFSYFHKGVVICSGAGRGGQDRHGVRNHVGTAPVE